jgi:hypothetical protein
MEMRRLFLLTLVLVLTWGSAAAGTKDLPVRHAPQAVYYVAPTGDDANPGTFERPWRTVQHAAGTLVAGDVVYIRAGTYPERVVPQNSGGPGAVITYAAYPGETPVLDGSSVALPDDLAGLFEISGRSYIRVAGLRVINAGPFVNNAGILVDNSGYVTLDGNRTDNTQSSGIGVWGSQQIVVRANVVQRAGGGGYQECITIADTGGFEVAFNTVLECEKEGLSAKDGAFSGTLHGNVVNGARAVGIYVDAETRPTHDIVVYQNLAFNSIESSGITAATEAGGLLSNIRIENNVAYHNATYGVEVSRCCTATLPMDNIVIVNNTLWENGATWGGGILDDNAQALNVVIRNNVVSQNLTFQIAVAGDVPPANVTVDCNLIDGYRGYVDEVYGLYHVEGDPRFRNSAAGDFHLLSGSPAIDVGTAAGAPALDFEGDVRPQDGDGNGSALYDVGADELTPPSHRLYLALVSDR